MPRVVIYLTIGACYGMYYNLENEWLSIFQIHSHYILKKALEENFHLCNTHTLGNTDYGNAEHKFSRRHGNEKI